MTNQIEGLNNVVAHYTRPAVQTAVSKLLPDHVNVDQIMRGFSGELRNNTKIGQCSEASVMKCLITYAMLGLVPGGTLGQCHTVPFKGEATPIIGFRGYITLAMNSGEILGAPNVIPIWPGDKYEVDYCNPQKPFKIKLKLDAVDRNDKDIIGVAIITKFKGGVVDFDIIDKRTIWKAAQASKSGWASDVEPPVDFDKRLYSKKGATKGYIKYGSVWDDHFLEMAKKTAIRRRAKMWPMSVINQAARIEQLVEQGKAWDVDQEAKEVIDVDTAPVIESDASGALDRLDNSVATDKSGAGDAAPKKSKRRTKEEIEADKQKEAAEAAAKQPQQAIVHQPATPVAANTTPPQQAATVDTAPPPLPTEQDLQGVEI